MKGCGKKESATLWRVVGRERAPHCGGLWEERECHIVEGCGKRESATLWRVVGSCSEVCKLHLRGITGQQILNFEEFSTLLCQVES